MSRKNKIIIGIIVPILFIVTLVTILLIFCLDDSSTIGKFAKVRGGITFEGTVNIDISNGVIEEGCYLGDITGKMQGFTAVESQNDEKVNSWKDLSLEFVKKEEGFKPITVNFEITNIGNEKIFVQYDAIKNLGNNADNITIDITGENSILPACTEVYSITFSVLEYEDSGLDNFDIKFLFAEEKYSEIKGDFTFVGENCNAQILNATIEENTYQGNIDGKFKNILLNNNQDENINTWKDLKLRFIENDDGILPIVLDFDIKNNMEEKLFVNFDITKGSGENSENIEIKCDKTNEISSFGQEHYKITFSLKEKEISKLENFNIKITLTKEEVSWVKGGINFAGEGFDALVSKGFIEEGTALAELENKFKGFSFLDSQNLGLLKQSWQNLKLQFIEKDNAYLPIEVEFDITNNIEERLFVDFNVTNGIGENSDNISIETIGNNIINGNSQEHYKIKFICQHFDISKLDNFQINISFIKEEIARVNGDISFIGENLKISISNGSLYGGNLNGDITSKFNSIDFEKSNESDFDQKLNTWKDVSMQFEKENFEAQPITLSFTITNNGDERVNLGFDIVKGLGINVDSIAINLLGSAVIQPNETENYTVTFLCIGESRTILNKFSININMEEAVSVRANGKISFSGTNINANISNGLIEEGSFIGDISGKMQGFNFNSSMTEDELGQKLSTWENIDFKFVENENEFLPITISFDILNNNYERYDLTVNLVKGQGENTDNINIQTTTIRRIAALNKLNYTIKFTVSEFIKSSLSGWELNIRIVKNYEAKTLNDDGYYNNMLFEFSADQAITASDLNVKGKALISSYEDLEDVNETLIIPAYIQKEDGLYRVVGIKEATSASNSVFANQNALKIVSLPCTFEMVGDYAFYGCANLSNIILRNPIQQIGNYAFYNCGKLSDIVIPDTVTSIGNYAFYNCTNLENVTVSKILKTIGDRSFYNCYRLTTLTLPETVTGIGSYAFYRCSALSNFVIPKNIKEIKDWTFYYCAALTEIELPAGLINIGTSAFESCYGLETLTFPLRVTNIGNNAFYNCKNLKSITMGLNVRTIGKNAFTSCPKLEEIIVNEKNKYFEDGGGNSIIEKSTNTLLIGCKTTQIAENVSIIGENAFYYSSELESITIPAGVITIAESAFDNCSLLSNIVFAPNSSLVTIGDYAFQSCKALQEINIPQSVETIGMSCFFSCSELKSIYIGKSVVDISPTAFNRCSNIESIVVSDENEVYESSNANAIIQKDGKILVLGCQNTIIPEGIKTISTNAFNGCQLLTQINIPASVETIESSAFSSCNNLKTVIIDNETIAEGLVGNSLQIRALFGGLVRKATTIYIKEGMNVGSYVVTNFTLSAISDGYSIYIK